MRPQLISLLSLAALVFCLMLTFSEEDVVLQKLFAGLSVVFGLASIAFISRHSLSDDNQHS